MEVGVQVVNELIVVEQLPIIREQLHQLKHSWEQKAADAEAMVCTVDTIQAVKTFRAEMRKEYQAVENLRLQIKKDIMEPYERFENDVYRVCVYNAFADADKALKQKIEGFENEIKRRCESGLRDYFAELCAVRHLDWLEYERACVKVDMASAKAKTPTKLRKQLADFVTAVGDAVDRIMLLDNADEIMVEFKRTLDAGQAICTVQDRHRRIEEQRISNDAARAFAELQAESIRKVEALAPPVVRPVDKSEDTITVKLVLHPTRVQFEEKIRPLMRQLKEICDAEGIRYE